MSLEITCLGYEIRAIIAAPQTGGERQDFGRQ